MRGEEEPWTFSELPPGRVEGGGTKTKSWQNYVLDHTQGRKLRLDLIMAVFLVYFHFSAETELGDSYFWFHL